MGNAQSCKSHAKKRSESKRCGDKHSPPPSPSRYVDWQSEHGDLWVEDAADFLQQQHFLLRHLWEGNFSAPIEQALEEGIRVLDIGCGPGTWVLEMATDYPNSHFVGIDTEQLFPSEIKPINVEFQIASIFDKLPFDDEFDFVHIQLAGLNFTERDWVYKVVPEILRVTKVGGYIELFEFDFRTYSPPPRLSSIMEAYIKEFEFRGYNISIGDTLEQTLKTIPSVSNIQHFVRPMEYNECHGPLAKASIENTIWFYRVIGNTIRKLLNISGTHYAHVLERIEGEFDRYDAYNNMHKVIARKVQ